MPDLLERVRRRTASGQAADEPDLLSRVRGRTAGEGAPASAGTTPWRLGLGPGPAASKVPEVPTERPDTRDRSLGGRLRRGIGLGGPSLSREEAEHRVDRFRDAPGGRQDATHAIGGRLTPEQFEERKERLAIAAVVPWWRKARSVTHSVPRTVMEMTADVPTFGGVMLTSMDRSTRGRERGGGVGAAPAGRRARGEEEPTASEVRSAEDHPLMRLGEGTRGLAERMYPREEGLEGSFLYEGLPGGLSSFGTFAGVGFGARAAGQSAALASTSMAGAGGVSRAYQEAVASGASEEDALLAARWGVVPGVVQVLPIMRAIGRFDRRGGGRFHGKVKRALASGGMGAAEEMIVEAAGQAGFNAIAQQIYDEDRELWEEVVDAATMGGTVGFLANVMLAAVPGAGRASVGRVPVAGEQAAEGDTQAGPGERRGMRQRAADLLSPEGRRQREGLQTERDEARREAETDGLTGVGNQAAFQRARESADADPDTEVLAFDVNNMKAVNDGLGHEAGDQLIQAAAGVLQREAGGRVFRTGGDEFVVLVPAGEGAAAVEAVESAFGSHGVGDHTVSISGAAAATYTEADRAAHARKEGSRTAYRNRGGVSGVQELHHSEIQRAPELLQYKQDMDADGVSGELKGVRDFDPNKGGMLLVWRNPEDGQTYVVNGHHRHELAERTGYEGKLAVRYIDAATAAQARDIGARTNISEGRGTAVDAAKVFRDSGATPADLAADGIAVTKGVAREGLALANLPQSLFERVARGEIPVRRAVVVGESGLTEAQQLAAWRLIEHADRSGRRITNEQVRSLLRFAADAGETQVTQETLFGTETDTQSLALEKAALDAWVRRRLREEQSTFSGVSRRGRAERLEGAGVGRVDAERAGELSTEAAQAAEVYERLSTRAGPIADALNDATRRLAEGENADAVREELYRRIREALAEAHPGATGAHAQGGPQTDRGGDRDPGTAGTAPEPGGTGQDRSGGVLDGDVESSGDAPATQAPTSDAPAEPGTAPEPGPRTVTLEVEGERRTVELDAEQAARWDEAEQTYRQRLASADRQLGRGVIGRENHGARRKAAGMERSAARREITGQLTGRERTARDKRERGNYHGKPVGVLVDGRVVPATVERTIFGKVRVTLDDGTTRTVSATEVLPPPGEGGGDRGTAEFVTGPSGQIDITRLPQAFLEFVGLPDLPVRLTKRRLAGHLRSKPKQALDAGFKSLTHLIEWVASAPDMTWKESGAAHKYTLVRFNEDGRPSVVAVEWRAGRDFHFTVTAFPSDPRFVEVKRQKAGAPLWERRGVERSTGLDRSDPRWTSTRSPSEAGGRSGQGKPLTEPQQPTDKITETGSEGEAPRPSGTTPTLPRALAGAKPRYGFGAKQFTLEFASDLDKALYIVAQKKPSAKDASYMEWVRGVLPGLTDGEIRQRGQRVRSNIKELARAAPAGRLSVPESGQAAAAPPGRRRTGSLLADESGFLDLSPAVEIGRHGVALAARVGRGVRDLVKKGYSLLNDDLINVVRGQGQGGQWLSEQGEWVTNRTKAIYGQVSKPFAAARAAASFGRRAQAAVDWLQHVEYTDAGHGVARWQAALQGEIPLDRMPERVRTWVTAQWEIQDMTGRMAEELGVVQRMADGTTRPLKHKAGGRIALRQATDYLSQMFMNPTGPGWDAYVRALSDMNDVSVQEVRRILDPLTRQNYRRTHAEIPRLLRSHPTHITVEGMRVPVLETHPFRYTQSTVRSAAHRLAFIEAFGQDISVDGEPTLLETIRDEAVQNGVDARDADNLLKALSGVPLERTVLTPGTVGYEVLEQFNFLVNAVKSGMLTRAWVPNMTEFMGNITTFGRVGNVIGAARAMGPKRLQETAEGVERMGLVIADVADLTANRDRKLESYTRMFGEGALRLFQTQRMWNIQETHGAVTGLRLAYGLRRNRGRELSGPQRFVQQQDYLTLRWLDFPKARAERMARGELSNADALEIGRRFASRSNTTRMTLPAEESRAQHSRMWKHWMWFTRYPMMKARSLGRVTRNLTEAVRDAATEPSKEHTARLGAATYQFGKYHAGTAMAGATGYALIGLLMGGPEGLKSIGRELEEDPLAFLAKSWGWAHLGPLLTSVGRVWTDNSIDNFWAASAGFTVLGDTVAAIMGWDAYEGRTPLERSVRWGNRRLPGPRAVHDLITTLGLTQDDAKLRNARREYWQWRRRNEDLPSFGGFAGSDEDRAFRTHMRKASEVMMSRNAVARQDEIDKHLDAALGVEGKDRGNVAQSIRARRMLARLSEEKREEFRAFSPEAYRTLEQHDELLDQWARARGGSSRTPGRAPRERGPATPGPRARQPQ